MAVNVTIPKGTRDFSPLEMSRRKYIFKTIEDVFRLYGYQPIETPAMENLSTLTGKYGEEGDRLIFKILNSGNFLEGITIDQIQSFSPAKLASAICDKALRYDLTVPFARYVVQHRNDITFPFKRYQIQPVWRADRPQKGRYREFYQCDADVIGSDSLLNEIELIQLTDEVFKRFGLKVIIKLNNRKILSGIAETIGYPEKLTDITIAIDKLDKIGADKVKEELHEKGISTAAIEKLFPMLQLTGTVSEKIQMLEKYLHASETGKKGITEINYVFEGLQNLQLEAEIEFDVSLARGLDYYTGAIIEVKAAGVEMGSICGGGRYDDLTGIFGLPGVSGVGISFGADRIYDVLKEKSLFPEETETSTKVLFVNFGEAETRYALEALCQFRKNGISAMLFPDAVKLKKQFAFADANKIPYVVIAGGEEIAQKKFKLKIMATGEEKLLCIDDLLSVIKK